MYIHCISLFSSGKHHLLDNIHYYGIVKVKDKACESWFLIELSQVTKCKSALFTWWFTFVHFAAVGVSEVSHAEWLPLRHRQVSEPAHAIMGQVHQPQKVPPHLTQISTHQPPPSRWMRLIWRMTTTKITNQSNQRPPHPERGQVSGTASCLLGHLCCGIFEEYLFKIEI